MQTPSITSHSGFLARSSSFSGCFKSFKLTAFASAICCCVLLLVFYMCVCVDVCLHGCKYVCMCFQAKACVKMGAPCRQPPAYNNKVCWAMDHMHKMHPTSDERSTKNGTKIYPKSIFEGFGSQERFRTHFGRRLGASCGP